MERRFFVLGHFLHLAVQPVSYTHLDVYKRQVEIRDKKGNAETVTVLGDVPYGHKIAVRDIKKGEYVHVHNLDSMRGRGDWAKEGK